MRFSIAGCLAVTFSALTACGGATDPIDYDEFIKEDGEGELGTWIHSGLYNRLYFLRTPPDMNDSQLYPLVIFLHGAGGTGEGMRNMLETDDPLDEFGFIGVYPDGLEHSWEYGCPECTFASALGADDVRFLDNLTLYLAEHLPVDTTRVYAVGHSQGGSLAFSYGCQSSHRPAGLGVVGSLLYRGVELDCREADPLKVVSVHGTADPMAYYTGFGEDGPFFSALGAIDVFREAMECDPVPTWTTYPDTAGDYTYVSSFLFTGCEPGGSVLHYRVDGGGHSWPGPTGPWGSALGPHSRNLDATRAILEFFTSEETGE